MVLTFTNILVFAIGGVLLLFWLMLYFSGKKYQNLFENLSEEEYPFKDLYYMGYAFMEMIHYKYKSKNDRKLRQCASILYDPKYSEYYVRLSYAQKVSLTYTILVAGFILYGFANDVAVLAVILVFAFAAYYYFGTLMVEKINKRQDELLSEFSEVISKLALLTNAGLILREAWEKVAYNGDSVIYQEMQRSVGLMNNGYSEIDAIQSFGNRCVLPEIKKATTTIIQGLVKGNKELVVMLQAQSAEAWNMKQHLATREGEKASSKLLIPMMLMFVGILIMILIPIFTNIGA